MSERFRHPHYAKLVIFQAPNGQSENWYAGFYHQGRFVRKSTQTDSKKDALDIAKKWYLQQQHLLEEGHSITSARRRFKDAVEFVKDDMVVKRNSETYQKSIMNLLSDTSYVGQFFGHLPVESITSSTWDDYRTWLFKKRGEEEKPVQSEKTIHQHKIAVQRVLKTARKKGWIDNLIVFEDIDRPKKKTSIPRIYFNIDEYRNLLQASRQNIQYHRDEAPNKGRWLNDALEMHDFIIWMANTGMRVGEALAIEFRHVRIVKRLISVNGDREEREVCLVTVPSGKRGAGAEFESFIGAPNVFKRIIKRRKIDAAATSTEKVFLNNHRTGFRRLLDDTGLYMDGYGRRRDAVSLRHTYIVFRLEQGTPIFDVARNTRTSATVIEKHYAQFFKPSKSLNDVTWGVSE